MPCIRWFKFITPEDLVSLLDSPQDHQRLVIIDCRDADRSDGWIVGSTHLPSALFTAERCKRLVEELQEKNALYIVFHCRSSLSRGPRAAIKFAEAQHALGAVFPSVLVLSGGFELFQAVYGNNRPDLFYTEMKQPSSHL